MLCVHCGQEAKYQFKNGNWCCSKSSSQCSEIKKKNNKHLKGTIQPPRSKETKEKISKALTGIKHSIEHNKLKSENMKKYWDDKRIIIPIEDYPLCECGCGKPVTKSGNRFILGHHTRVIDCVWNRGLTKETSESVKKQSDALKGRTKETHPYIKAQSEKLKEQVPWIKGKKHTEESKKKMSESILKLDLVPWNKGKTKETSKRLQKISKHFNGVKRGPNKEPFNDEIRKNQRLAAIKRIESKCGQLSPNYNTDACKLIDKYGKENNYNFQHAENGGEFHVSGLGYWADGYDKEKNVVIEVDESFHFDINGDLNERDVIRQKEITKHLQCEFIRLKI
jgi:hypothetical protein